MVESPIKFVDVAVTQQEVPDEISLTISVSNCLFRCPDCHSPEQQQDIGTPLIPELHTLLKTYYGLITCVCLMGEGQNMSELATVLITIKAHGLKTCLYSGHYNVEPFLHLLPLLGYIKVGAYERNMGGLDALTTNQRFYAVHGGQLIDETNKFQRKKEWI